jgi:hypothetical protein
LVGIIKKFKLRNDDSWEKKKIINTLFLDSSLRSE